MINHLDFVMDTEPHSFLMGISLAALNHDNMAQKRGTQTINRKHRLATGLVTLLHIPYLCVHEKTLYCIVNRVRRDSHGVIK